MLLEIRKPSSDHSSIRPPLIEPSLMKTLIHGTECLCGVFSRQGLCQGLEGEFLLLNALK
jgi:hypothetical protein